MNMRAGWEMARYTGYLAFLPHADRKKHLTVTDMGTFPWEADREKQSRTKRLLEMKEILDAEWQRMLAKAAQNK